MSENNKVGYISLDALAEQNHLELSIQSVRAEDPKDAQLRRFKDKCLFILTLILISLTFLGALAFLIFRPDSKNESIVLNGLVALVMLVAGYYVRGKNS